MVLRENDCLDKHYGEGNHPILNGWFDPKRPCLAGNRGRGGKWSQRLPNVLHACVLIPLSRGLPVNKQRIVSHEGLTRFLAKNYASVRFCRRSGPTTKFRKVCENFARNVGDVKYYCPFTRSPNCNFLQKIENFAKNVRFFRRVKRASEHTMTCKTLM